MLKLNKISDNLQNIFKSKQESLLKNLENMITNFKDTGFSKIEAEFQSNYN